MSLTPSLFSLAQGPLPFLLTFNGKNAGFSSELQVYWLGSCLLHSGRNTGQSYNCFSFTNVSLLSYQFLLIKSNRMPLTTLLSAKFNWNDQQVLKLLGDIYKYTDGETVWLHTSHFFKKLDWKCCIKTVWYHRQFTNLCSKPHSGDCLVKTLLKIVDQSNSDI